MPKPKTNRPAAVDANPRVNEITRFFRIFVGRGLVVFGMVIILLAVIVAVFAPVLAPYDPYGTDMDKVLLKPGTAHWLGTDALGRDVLSRLMYGTRLSLLIGLTAVVVAAVIGMALGLIAGYFGGWVYIIIMRCMDSLMSFPMILLALVIAALLGGGVRNVIIAFSIAAIPVYARLMCGQVMTVKQNDYVLAERSMGASNGRIMMRHVAPNCFPPLIVLVSMMLGSTMLAEAGLSFLGIGIQPPTPTWGAMVSGGYSYLISNPVLSLAPGLVLMLVVFAFNMVGDGLRDALDPRLRGKI